MRAWESIKVIGAATALAAVSSCATTAGGTEGSSSSIGTAWRVEEVARERTPALSVPAATIVFGNDGSISGMSACNSVGGSARWTVDGGFSGLDAPFISTLADCVGPLRAGMAFGDRFWKEMQTAQRWEQRGSERIVYFASGATARLRRMT